MDQQRTIEQDRTTNRSSSRSETTTHIISSESKEPSDNNNMMLQASVVDIYHQPLMSDNQLPSSLKDQKHEYEHSTNKTTKQKLMT